MAVPDEFQQLPICQYLAQVGPSYLAKVQDLHSQVSDWLTYIPNTFPHYTRHTIKHSEEIIRQLSKMLFYNDDFRRPALQLSSTECYVLLCAALLHDAGMVCSDSEKAAIIQSPEWEDYIATGGPGHARFEQLEEFRNSAPGIAESFVWSVHFRQLIADFVRRRHHVRSASLITSNPNQLGPFAFGDRTLEHTIATLCESHGLDRSALGDAVRFPFARDVRGEQVNVRLCAILLRLGDLLDVSTDRACPMLLQAAAPIPPESIAHWTQYQCIEDRLVSPTEIRFGASCSTAAEHEILTDWFRWLVDEVRDAHMLLKGSARHDWNPPLCTDAGDAPTITIRPAPSATYRLRKWHFELDHDQVLQRLISDLYGQPLTFVRELIQNAADATRCKVAHDLGAAGQQVPRVTSDLHPDLLRRYPIRVTLDRVQLAHELTGTTSEASVVTIADSGIGMTEEIIASYFLQVGRSYYTSRDFADNYDFAPASTFGLGFLSVFAESSYVTVETLHHQSGSPQEDALRIVIRGPNNYFAVQQGNRLSPGTSVAVRLDSVLSFSDVEAYIRSICTALEFPILLESAGNPPIVISKQDLNELEQELIPEDGKEVLRIRSLAISSEVLRGGLFVLERAVGGQARWDDARYITGAFAQRHPTLPPLQCPQSSVSFHGIRVARGHSMSDNFTHIVDYRGQARLLTLSRTLVRHHRLAPSDPIFDALIPEWTRHLETHLQNEGYLTAPDGWRYIQRLINAIPDLPLWDTLRVIPQIVDGAEQLFRVTDLMSQDDLRICAHRRDPEYLRYPKLHTPPNIGDISRFSSAHPAIAGETLIHLSEQHRRSLFSDRYVSTIEHGDPDLLMVVWSRGKPPLKNGDLSELVGLLPLQDEAIVGFRVHFSRLEYLRPFILNSNNSFTRWVFALASQSTSQVLSQAAVSAIFRSISHLVRYDGSRHELEKLNRLLSEWRAQDSIPASLRPPDGEITAASFRHTSESGWVPEMMLGISETTI